MTTPATSPILTDLAGIPAGLVPLVLMGFGVGSFAGTLIGGRFGDAHSHLVTVITPAVTTVLLLLISQLTGAPWPTATLVVLLGVFGLSANGVLIHLTVRFSTTAATLGAALSVSAFNCGTAIGTTLAGAAVTSSLGIAGPATIGTVIVALTLVPTITLALRKPLTEPDADRLVSASTECRRRPAGTRYRLAAAVTAALAQRPHTTPNDPTKRLMATADPRDSRHPHKPCCTL